MDIASCYFKQLSVAQDGKSVLSILGRDLLPLITLVLPVCFLEK